MNGCEMMRCTDYHDGICGIDGPCKYRSDENSVEALEAERDAWRKRAEQSLDSYLYIESRSARIFGLPRR